MPFHGSASSPSTGISKRTCERFPRFHPALVSAGSILFSRVWASFRICKSKTPSEDYHIKDERQQTNRPPGISQSGRESSTLLCHDLEPRLAYRAHTPPAFRFTITIIRPRRAKRNKPQVNKPQPISAYACSYFSLPTSSFIPHPSSFVWHTFPNSKKTRRAKSLTSAHRCVILRIREHAFYFARL